jgi:hypothetical protein
MTGWTGIWPDPEDQEHTAPTLPTHSGEGRT